MNKFINKGIVLLDIQSTVKPVLSDHSGDMEIAKDRWLLIAE